MGSLAAAGPGLHRTWVRPEFECLINRWVVRWVPTAANGGNGQICSRWPVLGTHTLKLHAVSLPTQNDRLRLQPLCYPWIMGRKNQRAALLGKDLQYRQHPL